jgi:hypothetical protein
MEGYLTYIIPTRILYIKGFLRQARAKIKKQPLWGPNFSDEKFSQSSGRRPAESPKELFLIFTSRIQ